MRHIGYGICVADACGHCGQALESFAFPKPVDAEDVVRCPRCEVKFCLRCADEVQRNQQLAVETAAGLQKYVGNAGLLDAIFTVGVYLTLGAILNTFDVPLDEAIRPLP